MNSVMSEGHDEEVNLWDAESFCFDTSNNTSNNQIVIQITEILVATLTTSDYEHIEATPDSSRFLIEFAMPS